RAWTPDGRGDRGRPAGGRRPGIPLAARARPRRRFPKPHCQGGPMTPVAVPPLPRRRNHLHELSAVVRRHLRQVRHSPEQLVELAVQPILFVLLFGVVLAGQMGGPEGNYLTFVVPGLMTQAAVLIAARTAIGLHADMDNGLLERMRALPISRLTPLAGRVIADILMLLWSLVVLIAASIAIGYRAHVTILGAVATIAVIVVFCFSLCWIAI